MYDLSKEADGVQKSQQNINQKTTTQAKAKTIQTKQGQLPPIQAKQRPVQRKEQQKSSDLKSLMGNQYGVDLSGHKEHKDSSFPGSVGALATIQGKDIHYAPGQFTEQNRKHELGHAIDNSLNGTPKGDKVVNGQNVDTTREKAADKIMNTPVQRKLRPESLPDTTASETEVNVVQRMIDSNFAQREYEKTKQKWTDVKTAEEAKTWLKYTSINNREQTFQQAVNEFIETAKISEPAVKQVKEMWKKVWEAIDLKKKPDDKFLTGIKDAINRARSFEPDHPNPHWFNESTLRFSADDGARHESSGTIPQTKESREMANKLIKELGEIKAYTQTWHRAIFGSGGKMLGVLVFPNKEVVVTISGSLPPYKMDYLETVVKKVTTGFTLKGVYNKKSGKLNSDIQKHYRANYKAVRTKDYDRKNRLKGNEPGNCAAASALSIDGINDKKMFVRPKSTKIRMGLTEVFSSGRFIKVSNRRFQNDGPDYKWGYGDVRGDSRDVPSCETCQDQLKMPGTELRIKELEAKKDRNATKYWERTNVEKEIKSLGEKATTLESEVLTLTQTLNKSKLTTSVLELKKIISETEKSLDKLNNNKAVWASLKQYLKNQRKPKYTKNLAIDFLSSNQTIKDFFGIGSLHKKYNRSHALNDYIKLYEQKSSETESKVLELKLRILALKERIGLVFQKINKSYELKTTNEKKLAKEKDLQELNKKGTSQKYYDKYFRDEAAIKKLEDKLKELKQHKH